MTSVAGFKKHSLALQNSASMTTKSRVVCFLLFGVVLS
jgi:hypothetical protein